MSEIVISKELLTRVAQILTSAHRRL